MEIVCKIKDWYARTATESIITHKHNLTSQKVRDLNYAIMYVQQQLTSLTIIYRLHYPLCYSFYLFYYLTKSESLKARAIIYFYQPLRLFFQFIL